ncbi:unnamed protein product [Malus baccata var. baccata]
MDVLVGPTFSIDVSSYGPAQTQDNRHRGGLYLNQNRGAAVVEEASSDSSSSIGVPDDSEEEEDSKDDDGYEVQSKFNSGGGSGRGLGSLGSFGSLEESLPIKRGLSNYFSGKSKSFASLSEVCSSVSSVKEVEKRDNPFNKRRRVLIASKWSRKSSSPSSLYNWPNPKSMPLLALAEEGDEDDDEEQNRDRQGDGDNASQQSSSDEEDQERRRAPQKLLHRKLKSFKSKSCYCLSDLQEHDEQ